MGRPTKKPIDKKKTATISIRQNLLDKCRELDPYFNLSLLVETAMIEFLNNNSEEVV